MNIEIKFRAWSGDRMIDFPYYFEMNFQSDSSLPYRCYEGWRELEDGRSIPCVLTQFTGLLDKNGKEIFKGDIIFNDDRKEHAVVEWSDEKAMWIVVYVESKDRFPLWESISNLYYKVGNIYQNPELLP